MKIIDKNKDYYDYLVGTYGEDELVVYDRRGSFPIDVSKPICSRGTYCRDYTNANFDRWFRREPLFDDENRKEVSVFSSNSIVRRRANEKVEEERRKAWSRGHRVKSAKFHSKILEGKVMFFVLEIGFYHYYFEVERYIDDEDDKKLVLNYALIDKKRIDKDSRLSDTPMSICPIHRDYRDVFRMYKGDKEQLIHNPILYATYIPKFIEAKEVWNNLYEYISSLRDKEIVDSRTNDEHIESHGFDKKISFRHRK